MDETGEEPMHATFCMLELELGGVPEGGDPS